MAEVKEISQEEKQIHSKQYRCFCSKSYNSYAGLYLHLKSKHQDAFSKYKNMKISKLLIPLESDSQKEVFRLKQPLKQENHIKIKQSQNTDNGSPKVSKQQEIKYRTVETACLPLLEQSLSYNIPSFYQSVPYQSQRIYATQCLPNPVNQNTVSNFPFNYYEKPQIQFYQPPLVYPGLYQSNVFCQPHTPDNSLIRGDYQVPNWTGMPSYPQQVLQYALLNQGNLKFYSEHNFQMKTDENVVSGNKKRKLSDALQNSVSEHEAKIDQVEGRKSNQTQQKKAESINTTSVHSNSI